MPLLDPTDPRPVHFQGIGGAGMSALAELLHRRGARVTGCDRDPAGAVDLIALGIPVQTGHDPAHLEDHRALVVSSAIPKDHPEVMRARTLGLEVVRRAEALAEATAGGVLIGIAGTHGKSTTTVMTTEALAAAGKEPTGVVGARVSAWGGNLSRGGHELFVVEADEYDRSFLALTPTVAVVTNVEADHLDIYADLADITTTFATYVRRARYVVLCADDPGANALPSPATAEVIRYGIMSPDARLVAREIRHHDGGSTFTVVYDGKPLGAVHLGVPGRHNVLNALAALACGIGPWGLTVEAMAPGLARFVGAERRFQRKGSARGVTVVDDYAHHPTEVAATLAAAREAYPDRRIVVAFQPHLFSRTRDFAGEFGEALAAADVLCLAEVYPAREQPLPGVTSALIADAATRAGRAPVWTGPRDAMAGALADLVREGDVVLTVGAGDVTKTGPELLARLGA
ncbi:MAG: UDP-N-acetylmuramate--L-alanine ligase [Gemmatimonadetes bacterium]|jgi:UDP-N-acetylmuramate--alanine ligase|nr:UDP-N-acetylmuramate--L-alanine ligase [Gemmatimonadota bacterium]